MPVHIEHIDTEIEVAPSATSRSAGEERAPASAPHAPGDDTLRRSVLCVLEAELDHYLRMRG